MWSGCALMAAVALAVQGFTQEKKPDQPAQPETKPPQVQPEKKPGAPAPTEMTPEEMMKLWQELNPLTPQHQEMAKAVGKYDVLVRYRMAPDAPMRESKGKAEFKLILDGRFIEQTYSGDMEGVPFTGLGIEGYDHLKKQFQTVWMDSTTNMMTHFTGTASPDGKVITYTGKMDDPMTGQKDIPIKMVLRKVSDDKTIFEMYETMPGGKEFKSMEMEYTRQK